MVEELYHRYDEINEDLLLHRFRCDFKTVAVMFEEFYQMNTCKPGKIWETKKEEALYTVNLIKQKDAAKPTVASKEIIRR